MLKAKSSEEVLENTVVECVHCGIPMTGYLGSGKRVRYFRCTSCRRWVSSTYAEILGADAKVTAKTNLNASPAPKSGGFDSVKNRLERWLTSIDMQDPYQILGVSPRDSDETVRNRYRELAFKLHPDRGGSGEQMRIVNNALERIARHREGRGVEARPLEGALLDPQS